MAIAVLDMCECVFTMPLFYSHFPRILLILAFVFSDSGFSIFSLIYDFFFDFYMPSRFFKFFLLVGFVHPFLLFNVFTSSYLLCCCCNFFISSEFEIPRLS